MKLSTLALGALISFSVNALAQDKPKTTNTTKNTKSVKAKTKKCVNYKVKKNTLDSLSMNSPENNPRNICYACGRG